MVIYGDLSNFGIYNDFKSATKIIGLPVYYNDKEVGKIISVKFDENKWEGILTDRDSIDELTINKKYDITTSGMYVGDDYLIL